jgi:aspartyl-tRNA(Asn)/glutamyl-tRNA(Gln) amidotransferase subunit B
MPWRTVIGLEVHARLLTASKAFCPCPNTFGRAPGTDVCPICLGYPGALPQLNRRAVELALAAALALGCDVQERSIFARKNYFYPDLPKGYQITQYDRPLATGGSLQFTLESSSRSIGIERVHLEEDAGKLMHDSAGTSRVDFNRAGIPLLEIVSRPRIASAAEAVAFATRLRQLLMYTGVCDGNMEEGSLRFDANISVRRDDEPLGTRAEVKNLNSFRFLARAIDFEVTRQIGVLEGGGRVAGETRLFDVASGETRAMRSKEESHDYRYVAEPDLLPLVVDRTLVESVRNALPELPHARSARYQSLLGIAPADAEVLVASRETAEYFEALLAEGTPPRAAARWVRNDVLGASNELGTGLAGFSVTPRMLSELIGLAERGEISGKNAKEVFEEMVASGHGAADIVRERGLAQISDEGGIRSEALRVIEAHPDQVAKYRAGRKALFGFFVGQVMKATGGRANAEIANTVLRELLEADDER